LTTAREGASGGPPGRLGFPARLRPSAVSVRSDRSRAGKPDLRRVAHQLGPQPTSLEMTARSGRCPAPSRILRSGDPRGCNGACGAVSFPLNPRRVYLVLDLAMSAPAGLAGLMIGDGPTRCVLRLAIGNRSLAGMIGTTRSPLGSVRRRTVSEPSDRRDPPLPAGSGPVALPRLGPRILPDGRDPGLSLTEAPAR
jgi:hypothetical protein